MAFFDTSWYINYGNGTNTGYYAVAQWTALTVYTAGQFVRQLATPAVGSERCFVCVIAGTTLASEPTWTVTRGALTAETLGPTWQECTGMPGTCGDITNSVTTATTRSQAITLGEMVYDSGTASLQICTTAGTCAAGTPSFSTTAGTTTADNTCTWTSLGLASNFSAAFGNPHARLANALTSTWGAASNQFAVASNHAETRAGGITLNCPGSTSTPNAIYCISSSTTLANATLATTATISTTGANGITIGGSASSGYFYGIQFQAGDSSNTASIAMNNAGNATANTYMENCVFKLNNTSTSSRIQLQENSNQGSYRTQLLNCSFIFGSTSQQITLSQQVIVFIGSTFAGSGSVPSVLFGFMDQRCRLVTLRDCDLSAITGTLTASNGYPAYVYYQNCKLGAAVSISQSTGANPTALQVKAHNCDSTNTNYRYFYQGINGVANQETTIVRTGSSATDGTTPISWKFVTTANSKYLQPFESEEISIWNDTTGSLVTATFYLISNTTLNNDDLWVEVEYAGTSGFPLGVNNSSRKILLATATALISDTSVWGGSTNKYKIVLTFTSQNKGPVKARFFAAKANQTTYIDPYIYLS